MPATLQYKTVSINFQLPPLTFIKFTGEIRELISIGKLYGYISEWPEWELKQPSSEQKAVDSLF